MYEARIDAIMKSGTKRDLAERASTAEVNLNIVKTTLSEFEHMHSCKKASMERQFGITLAGVRADHENDMEGLQAINTAGAEVVEALNRVKSSDIAAKNISRVNILTNEIEVQRDEISRDNTRIGDLSKQVADLTHELDKVHNLLDAINTLTTAV